LAWFIFEWCEERRMKKEIKRFKTGKKKQHESAISINIYTIDDNPTNEETEAFCSVGGANISAKERLNGLSDWAGKLMDIKATEMGLPDKTIISKDNAIGYGPLFVEARSIRAISEWALELYEAERYKEAFDLFQLAIPSIQTIQYLRFEDKIKAGSSRTSPGFQAKIQEKDVLKKLAKPVYDQLRKKGKGRLRAGELTAQWLEQEHKIKRSGKTIRDWFEVASKR
tara:strand:+ start:1955 stop:2632 length:678 start_codon:yes stop_codon:yes gene_type:complete